MQFQTSISLVKTWEWLEPQVISCLGKPFLDTIALWDSVFIALGVSYYIVRQHYFFKKAYVLPWYTGILVTDTFMSPVWILGKARWSPCPRHPDDYSLCLLHVFKDKHALPEKKKKELSKFPTLEATEPATEIMIMGLPLWLSVPSKTRNKSSPRNCPGLCGGASHTGLRRLWHVIC